MSTLKVIGSGSEGNCYLLDCAGEILVIECGCPLKEVKKALNFDLTHIKGAVIGHFHGDHAKYRKEFESLGVEVFAPYDTDKMRVNKQIGGYTIQAFRIPHGDVKCFGFLINHKSGERVLYLSDFSYTEFNFTGCKINHFLIECNYQDKYVDTESANFKHKVADHASLKVCRDFIKANVTPYMKSILLIHLGKDSTNPEECVAGIEKIVDCNTFVDYARPNTTYELKGKAF